MTKQIKDLTIVEAKELIDKLTVLNKQIEYDKIQKKKKRDRLVNEKKKIQEAKSKRMKILQEQINKTKGKIYKDRKRKSKQREAAAFDNRIMSKNKEINLVREEITKLDEKKALNSKMKTLIRIHIKSLK